MTAFDYTSEHKVLMHHVRTALREPDNDDRALFVRPLVQVFMDTYGNDSLEQAIGDLIADLGHLWDRLTEDEVDCDMSDRFATFEEFVAFRSFENYRIEVEEAA